MAGDWTARIVDHAKMDTLLFAKIEQVVALDDELMHVGVGPSFNDRLAERAMLIGIIARKSRCN